MSIDTINGIIEKSVDSKYQKLNTFKSTKRSISREVSDIQNQTYYMKNLEYQLKFENNSDYSKKTKKHLIDTFASIKYILTVRKPSDETIAKSKYQCAQLPNMSKSQSTASNDNLLRTIFCSLRSRRYFDVYV